MPSLLIASVAVGVVSVPFERYLYRRLYKSTDLEQVLLTIGLAFMAIASFTYFYGPMPKSVPLPEWLHGDVNLGFLTFPTYRVFLIVVGAGLIVVLWYGFEKTISAPRSAPPSTTGAWRNRSASMSTGCSR